MNKIKTILGKRAIAIFDILGFRKIVQSTNLKKLPELIKKTLNLTQGSLVSCDLVGSALFSDTIILFGLFGKDFFDESWIIASSSNLLNTFARFGIPIRGALTYGDIYINQEERTVVGPALVKGYDLGQKQNWMGAIVDPDYDDRFNKGLQTLPNSLHNNLIKYYAPFHSGIRREYKCIGWLHKSKPTEDDIHSIFIKNKDDEIYHDVYQKFLNTVEFLRYCRKNFSQNRNKDHFLTEV